MSIHCPVLMRAPALFVAAETGVTQEPEVPRLATNTVARSGPLTGPAACRAVSAGTVTEIAAITASPAAAPAIQRRRRRRTPARRASKATAPIGGSSVRAISSISRSPASSKNSSSMPVPPV